MSVQRRWLKNVIATATSDKTPMPWTIARAARLDQATKPTIRTTLSRKDG